MIAIIFAAGLGLWCGPGCQKAQEIGTAQAQIFDNLKSTAANCFRIGWTLHDMKVNPRAYLAGAYEKQLRQSHEACFIPDEK